MGLINQEVHLLREPLTAHPKAATLPGDKEVQRAWLHGVTGQMNLLRVVEAVVHGDLSVTGRGPAERDQLLVGTRQLSSSHQAVVALALHLHDPQVFLMECSNKSVIITL